MSKAIIEEAKEILRKNNQKDILFMLEKMDDEKKEEISNQIVNLYFEQLNKLYKETKEKPEILEKKIEHIHYSDKYKLPKDKFEEYLIIGENVIKNGKYAVVTMAGGQGTRLGHKGPKGTYQLNVENGPKYLFQILAENLENANKKYNVIIPWYIMTSTENEKDTVDFFETHNYFGYDKNNVKFFVQGNLPLMLFNGSLVLDKEYRIKEAADGNGCIYKSMREAKILDDMKNKNIEWVFIGPVDNALLNMVDPVLIGLTISEKHQVASKSISKNNPHEKVGVFCKANGKPSVIEYSELPEEMAEERDKNGELLYGEAHIMCNLFSMEALEKISQIELPYHVACKKSPYIDVNGHYIEPIEPNAYKFEAFIFDAFNYFEDMSILRGKREEDFAPIKNKEGNDSPETAKKLYDSFWNEKNRNK